MFKYLLTMLLTFVIGISTVALSQDYYCYSESGSTFELTVQDSIVSVKLDESRASWQGLFLSESGLDPTVAPEPICEGFALLHVTSGYDPVALVQRLRNHQDVLFANLSFLDVYGNPIYLAETFVANFHSSVPQAQIDSMNTAHGVVILDSFFNDPTWLLLKLTGNSDLDVLTMGNHYHESALVRYAKAGMVLNLQLDSPPYDEYWWYQWHFENNGQLGGRGDADIDLELTFDYHQPPPSGSRRRELQWYGQHQRCSLPDRLHLCRRYAPLDLLPLHLLRPVGILLWSSRGALHAPLRHHVVIEVSYLPNPTRDIFMN